jgi:SPOR domain
MADRYQDRAFPANNRGDERGFAGGDDPLAELARLIGQTDPLGGMGRANQRPRPATPPPPAPPMSAPPMREELARPPSVAEEDAPPVGAPPWMQRAVRQEVPQPDFPGGVHPLQRQAAQPAPPAPDFRQTPPIQDFRQAPPMSDFRQAPPMSDFRQAPPPFAAPHREPVASRYDDALYGRPEDNAQDTLIDQGFADDAYGYQEGYDDEDTEEYPRRRGGMFTVVVVLGLVMVGTAGAFAYRALVGSSRSGEPPIIKADASPTKMMPATPEVAKVPDRLASAGDGTEKIVPREEAPMDVNASVNARSGPRVVLPPLSQNANPPTPASLAPGIPPISSAAAPPNGTLPNNEPRRIKTLMVRGDQQPPDIAAPEPVAAPPPAKPAPRAMMQRGSMSTTANASASAPISLMPQGAAEPAPEPRTRVAATNPMQAAPSGGGASGEYLVQISSQRNEADAQASYRMLQNKFQAILGTRPPVIKRADLGEKGIYYRAMVGPFGTSEEASQLCSSLKTAGGQCVIQRN